MSFLTKLIPPSPSGILAAAKERESETIEALLQRKPDAVYEKDNVGWTALHCAAHWGHKEFAELLLANKASVNAKATSGLTPLHIAAAQG